MRRYGQYTARAFFLRPARASVRANGRGPHAHFPAKPLTRLRSHTTFPLPAGSLVSVAVSNVQRRGFAAAAADVSVGNPACGQHGTGHEIRTCIPSARVMRRTVAKLGLPSADSAL